ncbi:MAG: hypothetical protein JNK85_01825 [Verrucomicrobiales bacterium]|nr:hypothetical protein [Verrucomicrobiales bacterium]
MSIEGETPRHVEARASNGLNPGRDSTRLHRLGAPCYAVITALVWLGSVAHGQLPLARITAVYPPGAQCGTTSLVTIQGSDLDSPERLIFSDPRIQGLPSTNGPTQFRVVIPPEVQPGTVDLRFVGRFGVSNPRVFALDTLPELQAGPDHRATHQAFDLPLDTVVNGRAAANARTWFRLRLLANQRCVFQIQARAIDSRLEPVLTLETVAGNELARSRRGFLDFQSTAEGIYLLALHDVTFRGGDEYAFRLVASTGPHLDAVAPGVLIPGKSQSVILYGRQLPGGKPSAVGGADGRLLESCEVTIQAPEPHAFTETAAYRPATVTQPGFWWRWTVDGRRSNPIFFAVSSPSLAPSTHFPGTTYPTLQPPVDLWSQFGPRQRPGGVTFEAKKGEVWWLEVFSERLGFNADPQVVVQRLTRTAEGAERTVDVVDFQDLDANFGTPGYPTTSRDSAGRLEIPEDGTYRITVFDVFNPLPTQPRHPYRLLVRPPTPHFQLVAHPISQPPADPNQRPAQAWPIFLRKGETIPIRILAFRREGFDGEIEYSATNLPAGMTATPTRLYPGQNTATLLLQANEDAAPWTGPLTVHGWSGAAAEIPRREAFAASILWNVGDSNIEPVASRPTRGIYAAISAHESAPVIVATVAPGPIEAEEGAQVLIPLRIERRGDYKGELKLKAFGHPELEKLGELIVPPNATNATLEIKLAERKLPAGKHCFFLQGLTQGKYRNQPEAVDIAVRELQAATDALASASAEQKAAAEAVRNAAEARKKAAEERAQPRDVTIVVTSSPIQVTVKPAFKS